METIGRFEIREQLGPGAAGPVFRAYDPERDCDVALEILPLDDPAAEQRLSTQFQAAAGFHHPHAAAVWELIRVEHRACIVSEMVRGASLLAMVSTGGASSHREILRVLSQAAFALDAAHAAGLLHGGLHPGNVLLDETGQVKIAGFAVPPALAANSPHAAPYAAPELLAASPADGRSGQFSLAVLAYQLFTGDFPGYSSTGPVLDNAQLPPSIVPTLQIALQSNPLLRFPSCSAFVSALQSTSASAAAKPDATRRLLVLAPIALLAMVFAWFLLGRASTALEDITSVDGGNPEQTEPAAAPPQPQVLSPGPPAAPQESLSLVLEGIPVEFASIPPGAFSLACDPCGPGQSPRRLVQIPRPFQIGRTEVTDLQWNALLSGKATGSSLPKVNVSWEDVQTFLQKLNARADGFRYRLPTEAEWEYAARAGATDDGPNPLTAYAWSSENSAGRLHDIAGRIPNFFGLYDTLGNAAEWTAPGPDDPAPGPARVFRGGAFSSPPSLLTYSARTSAAPSAKSDALGFRLLREKQ